LLDSAAVIALALTTRIVKSEVKPLSAGEFWPVVRGCHGDLNSLRDRPAPGLAQMLGVPAAVAERLTGLIARSTSVALAMEQLENKGTWTLVGVGDDYPARLRDVLGDAAPPALHGVGDQALLGAHGLGVVGSRDVTPEGAEVAVDAARVASELEVPVISGAARGVDQFAMNAALEAGGRVVGVVADALDRVTRRGSTRQAVMSGSVCLVTPFAPAAGFTPASAMGRNKVIYGLSRSVLVVASDDGSGGTWAGAKEALRHSYAAVYSWTGPGAGPGNPSLVSLGASPVADMRVLRARFESTRMHAVGTAMPPASQLAFPV
jgi:predicted Rossmann fold nucleotide-binding protein DprA/Smf involved in DNA uptake